MANAGGRYYNSYDHGEEKQKKNFRNNNKGNMVFYSYSEKASVVKEEVKYRPRVRSPVQTIKRTHVEEGKPGRNFGEYDPVRSTPPSSLEFRSHEPIKLLKRRVIYKGMPSKSKVARYQERIDEREGKRGDAGEENNGDVDERAFTSSSLRGSPSSPFRLSTGTGSQMIGNRSESKNRSAFSIENLTDESNNSSTAINKTAQMRKSRGVFETLWYRNSEPYRTVPDSVISDCTPGAKNALNNHVSYPSMCYEDDKAARSQGTGSRLGQLNNGNRETPMQNQSSWMEFTNGTGFYQPGTNIAELGTTRQQSQVEGTGLSHPLAGFDFTATRSTEIEQQRPEVSEVMLIQPEADSCEKQFHDKILALEMTYRLKPLPNKDVYGKTHHAFELEFWSWKDTSIKATVWGIPKSNEAAAKENTFSAGLSKLANFCKERRLGVWGRVALLETPITNGDRKLKADAFGQRNVNVVSDSTPAERAFRETGHGFRVAIPRSSRDSRVKSQSSSRKKNQNNRKNFAKNAYWNWNERPWMKG